MSFVYYFMAWSFLPSIFLRLRATSTTHRGFTSFPFASAFTTSFASNTSTTSRNIKRLALLSSSSSSSSTTSPISDTTSFNTNNMSSLSIADFVKGVKQRVIAEKQQQQQEQQPHTVIGNTAGDADSVISAIALAYVKTLQQQQGQQLIVPIVSILADDLKFLRPETTYLLKDCAGMDNIKDDVNDLIAIDQIDELLPSKATVTLVDHNYNQRQEQSQWTVTEIVDHHLDEGKHMDTSPPQQRNIAFENSKALVASCATLVAEQFYNNNNDDGTTKTKMHPTLAVLLLGVILIDSVNMSEQVGKGTPRDSVALQQLLDDTDWTQIKLPDEILGNNSITRPDPTKFFNHLQDLKFSSEFWSGLTSSQAIRMDYKSFSTFGLSSILLDMTDFFNNNKESVLPSVAKVIRENQLELFGMMFCTDDGDNKFKRELALFSTNKVTMDRLMKHLTGDNTTPNLEIEVLHEEEAKTTTETLYIVRMKQGNITASRKQVAPILLEFFQNE